MNRILVYFFFFAFAFQSFDALSAGSAGIQEISSTDSAVSQTATPEVQSTPASETATLLLAKTREQPFSVMTLFRGFAGMVVLILLGYMLSHNRRNIPWKTVFTGLALQVILAVSVLYIPFVRYGFEFAGHIFVKILDFTKAGSEFLLGGLMNTNTYGYIFLFQVLPTIIFFSALTSLLFYWGIIQKVVWAMAWVFTRLMKISGAEALSVAGNIFLGQTESPLMIKAYLPKMGNSEILLVMTGGMATLAGGVLAAYIAMLGGDDPALRLEFAKHLLTASVMAAPAAIVFSKMIVPPDTEINKDVEISRDKIGSNVLDSITNGTSEGVKLAVNVAAMLLAFIAFIAMFNFVVGKIGQWTSLNELIVTATNGRYEGLSLQFILGYTFAPLMWLIGITTEDIVLVGRLLGEKLILTEFIGYISLAELKTAGVFASQKSVIMATYLLCGFANVASIGIQIGGIGSLAPNKRVLLSKYGVPALIAGTLTSLMSATIIGMLMG
jgi:concentrative nucleoside transporter, CNT family